jgi:hypothetical protein
MKKAMKAKGFLGRTFYFLRTNGHPIPSRRKKNEKEIKKINSNNLEWTKLKV